MNETLLSLSWWLERMRWLKEHKGAGLASLLAVLLIAALLEGLLQYIREHPARATIVVLALLVIATSWMISLYRILWIESLQEVSRVADLQRELEAERAKVAKLETAPKPPTDPLPSHGMKRVLTYLVNSCEATSDDITKEIGEASHQTEAHLKTLVLDYGFLARRTTPQRTTYFLTELAEDYIAKFAIPTINRGTMRKPDES
jgi:O-methyltransferase involved in polyketide biosynthesis